ncbi:MAG TPA: clostripain family protease, partial [Alistipes sp.]|nr:clostripain family protease [Alistipes sp.]
MTAPLLRRLAAGLLILPLLFGAGCSDDKTERPSLTLSAEKIVLPSEAGATARLDVTASGPWQLEISGSGFDASPLHGGRGTTSVTLTATETNTSTARTSLGSLHLFMPQSGPELTVTVEQRPAVAAQTPSLRNKGC